MQGRATAAMRALRPKLAERRRLVLLLDDSTSPTPDRRSWCSCSRGATWRRNPPHIHLVVAAVENQLLELFFRDSAHRRGVVDLSPSVRDMLVACRRTGRRS